MFVGLQKWLLGIIVVMAASGYVLFNALVAAKSEVKILKTTNTAYVQQIEQNTAAQKAFELAHKNMVTQFQEKEARYKRDAARERLAVAKPTLVQKLANKKFKEQEKELACLTGNPSKC